MKRNYNILAILLGVLFMLPGLVKAQDPKAVVTPNPLMVYGDSVRFTASITVPQHKVMKKEGTYVIMPELGEFKFPVIRIPSSELDNAAETGISVIINSSLLFREDMIGNDLEIEHEYEYKDGKKNQEFKDMDDVGECCITTGTLFALNGQYSLKQYDYTPASSVPLKVVAQLNFPQDISKFSPKNFEKEIKTIGEYLKEYPDAKITVRGYASPEGTVQRNRQLAQERAAVAKDWVVKALNQKGYRRFYSESSIQVEVTTEDWKGLKQVLSMHKVPQEKQNEVVAIMSNADLNMAQKEDKMIKALGGMKEAEKYLMHLRRATVVAVSPKAQRAGLTKEQVNEVVISYDQGYIPLSSLKDVFSKEEYLQAYQETDAKSGKVTLLTGYYESYPADVRVYSDLGALTAVDMSLLDKVGGDDALIGVGFDRDLVDIDSELDLDRDKIKAKYKYKLEDTDGEKVKMKMKADLKKMKEAEVLFKKAYKATPNDFVVLNNLGAYYLSTGDYNMARQYLDKSMKVKESEAAHYNLGVYHARMGNYERANDHFKKVKNVEGVEYNKGLAQLMTGNTQDALVNLQKFANAHPDLAIAHYVTAAAAAKLGRKEVMLIELDLAMSKNSDLSDVAAEDLMFREYWNDSDFKKAADDD